jgi:hypothetical protein
LGKEVAERLNAGLLRIQRESFSLERLEAYLESAHLLEDPTANFVHTEQTLYACELPTQGAVRLDPKKYATWWDPIDSAVIVHYCGGIAWAPDFHKGLDRLAETLGLA